MKTNENANTMVQNLWDEAKVALIGKFIATQGYLKKHENSQINNLTLHVKELEKEQTKHQTSKRKEIIKIRATLNDIETKKKRDGGPEWLSR